MEQFGMSMLWYWIAYIIVTVIGVLHTVFNIYVLKMKPMDDKSMGEGYEKTKPFLPLYNIIIFPIFAYLYFRGLNTLNLNIVIITSLIWGTLTVIFDVFGWIIVKHPWSLSFKEFYVDYQPWITLIYISIYASPFLAYVLMKI